jgi:hypothetical protein
MKRLFAIFLGLLVATTATEVIKFPVWLFLVRPDARAAEEKKIELEILQTEKRQDTPEEGPYYWFRARIVSSAVDGLSAGREFDSSLSPRESVFGPATSNPLKPGMRFTFFLRYQRGQLLHGRVAEIREPNQSSTAQRP